jgi:TolA-binding protein
MTVTDLHPEELLDRARLGTITAAERALLDAHVVRCPACRMELALHHDFQAELGASDDDYTFDLLTVAHAKARASTRIGRGARFVRSAAVAFAGALFLLSTVAAAHWTGVIAAVADFSREVLDRSESPESEPETPRRDRRPDRERAAPAEAPAPTPDPVEPAPSPRAEAEAPSAGSDPRETAERAREPLELPSRTRSDRPLAADDRAPAPAAEPPLDDVPDPTPTAAALFDEAASARRSGDRARAMALCEELLARHPSSREAAPVLVILGRLRLDRGDAARALPLFDRYLARGGGNLHEEAMVGRARALERLGDAPRERRAWEDLLLAHPSSPSADHARARLARLGAR